MFKYFIAALFVSHLAFAQQMYISEQSRYWKFHNWAAVGYRYDRQQFTEYSGNTSTENSQLSIHGRSSPFLTIGNHTEFKNVLVILRGAYGWLGYGRVDYNLPGNYGAEPLSFDHFKDGSGYSAEGQVSLSYILNFYDPPRGNFTFSLIPGVGYHYFHLMDYPSGIKTSTIGAGSPTIPAGTSGYAKANFIRPIQQDWYGPFFEGRLLFRFMQKTQIEFFYQYHLPNMRLVNSNQVSIYLLDNAGALTQYQQEQYHNVAHGKSLRTQLGGFDLRVHGQDAFTFGLHFEGAVTWSNSNRYHVHRTQQQYLTNAGTTSLSVVDRMSIHWVNYMTYMSVGYRF